MLLETSLMLLVIALTAAILLIIASFIIAAVGEPRCARPASAPLRRMPLLLRRSRRRALELLAGCGPEGCAEAFMKGLCICRGRLLCCREVLPKAA
jgi:hypothetical protein